MKELKDDPEYELPIIDDDDDDDEDQEKLLNNGSTRKSRSKQEVQAEESMEVPFYPQNYVQNILLLKFNSRLQ